jgi:hypothetical protein
MGSDAHFPFPSSLQVCHLPHSLSHPPVHHIWISPHPNTMLSPSTPPPNVSAIQSPIPLICLIDPIASYHQSRHSSAARSPNRASRDHRQGTRLNVSFPRSRSSQCLQPSLEGDHATYPVERSSVDQEHVEEHCKGFTTVEECSGALEIHRVSLPIPFTTCSGADG